MALAGFDQQGFSLKSPSQPKPVQQKQGSRGIISSLVSPFINTGQAVSNAIGNTEVKAAHALGLANNTNTQTSKQQFGAIPIIGGIVQNQTPKTFAGNAAQVGGTLIAPESGAGLLSKVATGARAGAVVGAGSGVANNENLGGVIKSAGEGAAIGGAIPAGTKLLGKAAGVSKIIPKGTPEVGATAGATVPAPNAGNKVGNALIKQGTKTEAKLGSFAPGQKVAGKQLSTADSNRLLDTVKNEQIGGLSAPDSLSQVESKIGQLQNANKTTIAAKDNPFTDEEKATLQNEINNRLSGETNGKPVAGGNSPGVLRNTGVFNDAINNIQTHGGLNDYKSSIDNQINHSANPSSAVTDKNLAANNARQVINEFLSNKFPEVADNNSRLTNLHDLKGAYLNASGKLANMATGGEGLTGRIMTSEPAEKAKSLIGKSLVKSGKAVGGSPESALTSKTSVLGTLPELMPPETEAATNVAPAAVQPGTLNAAPTPEVVQPFGRDTSLQSSSGAPTPVTPPTTSFSNPRSAIANLLGKVTPPISNPLSSAGPSNVAQNLARTGIINNSNQTAPVAPETQPDNSSQLDLSAVKDLPGFTDGSGDASQPATSDDPFSADNIKAAILQDMQNGGKNVSSLVSLYNTFGKPAQPPALTAAAQKEVYAGQTAVNRLQQYGQQIDELAKGSSGNVATGKLSILLGKYDPIATGSQKEAAALEASRRDVALQLATALNGGNKPSAQTLGKVEESLPSVSDSPQLRKDKLDAIISGLNRNLQTYAQPISSLTTAINGGATSNGDIGSQLNSVLGSSQ